MDRRHGLALLLAATAIVAVAFTLAGQGPQASTPLGADQEYPEGAGPTHVDFSALETNGQNVSHAPRDHWDSYVIDYTAPPERPLVEGSYYVNASTGEIITERWYDAGVYRNGSTYAFVQPADSIPDTRRREEFESDDSYVYDDTTDAYYRYDPRYGRLAPTTIGRHTDILESYAWEAVNTTTHHGVPVITYQMTGKRANSSRVPPARGGTLRLGVGDGIIYAYDVTLAEGESTYNYAYEVRPAPFPDHEWVETAKAVAAANTTADGSSDRRQLHRRRGPQRSPRGAAGEISRSKQQTDRPSR